MAEATPRRSKDSPATQMAESLTRLKRAGLPFDQAWVRAFTRVQWPHLTKERAEWKAALTDTRDVWRRAYEGAGQEGGERALTIFVEDKERGLLRRASAL